MSPLTERLIARAELQGFKPARGFEKRQALAQATLAPMRLRPHREAAAVIVLTILKHRNAGAADEWIARLQDGAEIPIGKTLRSVGRANGFNDSLFWSWAPDLTPTEIATHFAESPEQLDRYLTLGDHFSAAEFASSGSGLVYIDGRLRVLPTLRKLLGDKPLKINSAYRDPAHNARVGGAGDSDHLYGRAIDLDLWNHDPNQVLEAALKCRFNAIGTYPHGDFIHLGMRDEPARWGKPFPKVSPGFTLKEGAEVEQRAQTGGPAMTATAATAISATGTIAAVNSGFAPALQTADMLTTYGPRALLGAVALIVGVWIYINHRLLRYRLVNAFNRLMELLRMRPVE